MHKIISEPILKPSFIKSLNCCSKDIKSLEKFIKKNTTISISSEKNFVKNYERDWSNIKGWADTVARPTNIEESAILLYLYSSANIPITISAGKTNLTGSATPNGGLVINTELMISTKVKVDKHKKTAKVPIGEILEKVRNKILNQTNNLLYYPVDPTSRKDARVGGTISCNASGFIPGEKGATRFWIESISILLINGRLIKAKRGQFISKKNVFYIDGKKIPLPNYNRPNIKNASGPFSTNKEEIDFVDLIIGSEGIFGMIVECELKLDNLSKNYMDFFIPLKSESIAINFYQYINKVTKKLKIDLKAFEYFGYNSQKYMNNKSYLFNSKYQVGIYMQIPIFDSKVEDIAENWMNILNNSKCDIELEKVLILNQDDNWDKFFEARHSIPVNALEATMKLDAVSMITDTIVPPEHFKEFLDYTHQLIRSHNIEYLLFGHLGDCHLHFHLIHSKQDQDVAVEIYDNIVKKSSDLGGVYSAEHGTGKRKRNDFIECYGLKAVNQIKLCKRAFDSKMLLNQGNIIK
jgi:D-lactate dehydrogenase (cytochrome)